MSETLTASDPTQAVDGGLKPENIAPWRRCPTFSPSRMFSASNHISGSPNNRTNHCLCFLCNACLCSPRAQFAPQPRSTAAPMTTSISSPGPADCPLFLTVTCRSSHTPVFLAVAACARLHLTVDCRNFLAAFRCVYPILAFASGLSSLGQIAPPPHPTAAPVTASVLSLCSADCPSFSPSPLTHDLESLPGVGGRRRRL
jgi:hypothetical protein